jgi:type VI secretion system protein ImpL
MPGQIQPRDNPETIVDSRFEALRRLAGGGGGPSPIDGTLQILNEYYSMLAASDSAIRSGGKPPVSDLSTKLRAEAGRLPQPARQVVEDVVATGEIQLAQHVRQSKNSEMAGEVTRLCQQAIGGRYPFVKKSSRDVPLEDFARLFGPGGKFDDYFQRNLVEMVDVSTHPWTLKEGARGQMGAGVNIASFEQARTIREVFFRSGSDIPKISLTLKPIEMDPAITSFVLDVDGQVIRYQHGPQIAQTITWPGPRGSQQVRVMLEPAIPGSTSGESKEGPWALHRLFDSASISPGPSPEKFLATLSIGGRRVTLEVTASSVQNPFRMREIAAFSCPSAL